MISTFRYPRAWGGALVALVLLAAGAGIAGAPEAFDRKLTRPLEVILATPGGDVERVESIDVAFSKPMVASEERRPSKKSHPLVIDPPIPGSASWIGSRALRFVPQSQLPVGTRLICTLPQGTQSLDGDALASDFSWEIVICRPRLMASLPADGGRLTPDGTIHLLFSSPPEDGIDGLVRLVGPDGEVPTTPIAPDGAAVKHFLGDRPTPGQTESILALQPLEALGIDEEYRIEIDAEIAISETRTITFRTIGAPRIESVEADDEGITLHLTAPVDARSVPAHLEIEPTVPDLVVRNRTRSELLLTGDFRGSTTYILRLLPGLASHTGALLEAEEQVTVTTPSRPPHLRIVPSHGILQRQPDARIRIEGVNLDTVMVFAAWVSRDSIPTRLFKGRESWPKVPLPPIARWHAPLEAPDSIHALDIPLEQLGRPAGEAWILHIRAQARSLYPQRREYRRLHDESLIQVTDVGLSVFAGSRQGFAWVTSVQSGNALEGAEIHLLAPGAERPLWSGTSSADGLAWFPGISMLPLDRNIPLFAVARTGGDAVWLRLDTGHLADGLRYRGYLTTDRPSYLPGETVRWIALARKDGPEGIGAIDLPAIGYRITAARSGRQIGQGSIAMRPPGNGEATFAIDSDERSGTYRISLTAALDGSGESFESKLFWITTDPDSPYESSSPPAPAKIRTADSGAARLQRDRCRSLELDFDAQRYSPGDTARLTLSAPKDGVEALVLVFDQDIRQVHRISPLRGGATLPIPLTNARPPRAWIQALLAGPAGTLPETPNDPPFTGYACGKADLPIGSDPWRLDIGLEAEQKVYVPGEEIKLQLSVRDLQGNPVSGAATIIALPEARRESPPGFGSIPLASIFPTRGPEIFHADNRSPLDVAPHGWKGPSIPHETDAGIPERIGTHWPATTAYWEALRPIGPDGQATVLFSPSAEETFYRVRAIVCSGPDRFGYGELHLEVREPLHLECITPRFAHEGDEIEVRAIVHSRLEKKVKVEIEAEAEGATIDGKSRRKIKVKSGENGEARFRLVDPKSEGTVLRIQARSKEHHDSAEITIPARRNVVWERSFLSGTVNPSMRTVLEIPDGVLPEFGGLTTIVSPSILGGLEETLTPLIEEPYRSLEELAASLLAIAARGRLLDHFSLPDTTGGFDADRRTAAVVEAILDCVGPREIRSWPSLQSPPATDSMIAYTLYALAQANERGYPIPNHLLDRVGEEAWGRLHRMIRGSIRGGPTDLLHGQSAWLLWALSEVEQPPGGNGFPVPVRDAEFLFSMREQLPVTARTALGLALANLRHRDGAESLRRNWPALSSVLAQEIRENGLRRSGRTAWIATPEAGKRVINDGDVLATALFLRFLSLVDPGAEDLPGMVSWILSQRRPTTGSWWNSRTTAWTLDLLISTVSGIEGPSSEISGQIAVSGRFEPFRFRGPERRGDRRFTPMHRLIPPEGGTASHQLLIDTDGRRSVYFTARIDQARSALETDARDEGLILDRTYVDIDGRPFEKEIPQGDRLFIELRIVVPQDAHTLYIEDHLPAGITLPERRVDPSHSRIEASQPLWEIESDLNIVHYEIGDGKVRFYADNVPAGSCRIRYAAIATLAGEYRAPGTRAGLLEDTETFAISPPVSVRIKDKR